MKSRLSTASLFVALFASSAVGADIFVGPGQSIQAAIAGAAGGDRVLVQPGTYNEAIDFLGKSIEVIGRFGPSVTTIDATGTGTSAVSFVTGELQTSVLRGFRVTGGTGSGGGGFFGGGGIRVQNGADVVVRECHVVKNSLSQSGLGAGVYAGGPISTAQITMVDCVVAENQGRGAEGNLTLRRCTVSSNTDGGLGGWRLDLSECLITANTTPLSGGGLAAFSPATLSMDRCVFSGNQAVQNGGGLYVTLSDFPLGISLAGCWFVGNTAGGSGGGAYVLKSSDVGFADGVGFSRSVFANNSAGSGIGGGLYLAISNFLAPVLLATVEECSFFGNVPSGFHGQGVTVMNVRESILWGQPNPITASGTPTINVSQSDVQGGWPGTGNFNADPLFADASNGDLHLLAGSPCIDVIPSTGLAIDFEGDARDAFDDVGADEFAPHLYVRGRPVAGAQVTIGVAGPPGAPLLFFSSLVRDDVGVPTPYGVFGLGFPLAPGFPIGLGALPASGWLGVPVTLPPSVPPGVSIHSQVFFGTVVSNVESIRFE